MNRIKIMVFLLLTASCGKGNPANAGEQGLKSITFEAGGNMTVAAGEIFDLTVKGVCNDGSVVVVSDMDMVWEISGAGVLVQDAGGMFEALRTGTSNVTARYGGLSASVKIIVAEGKGILSGSILDTSGNPVAGVVVSDGDVCARTNAGGRYGFASRKRCGYLFVSIPAGYEATVSDYMIPQFFHYLSSDTDENETHDFNFKPVSNNRFTLIASSDHHLCNRVKESEDLQQFYAEGGFIDDVKATAATASNPVYSLCMGDMSWEERWYSHNYTIADYRNELKSRGYPTPIFHCIGNHDNDSYVAADWEAAEAYRKSIGPTYYSFNLGKVHFVVLDNIVYINTGGQTGTIGKLNYTEEIDNVQFAWLQRDLSYIEDKTAPIVVVLHCPLYKPVNSNGKPSFTVSMQSTGKLVSLLAGFENVYAVSGHFHNNHRTSSSSGNIREFNIAASSGTWWWTGKYHGYDVNVCRDGSPGGYQVFEFDGNNVTWRYKGIGKENDYRFRAYDMSEVLKNERIISSGHFGAGVTAGGVNDSYTSKDVLVNVWEWDNDWTISATENGQALTGVQVRGYDPMHVIAYTGTNAPFKTGYNNHMWKFSPQNASSDVVITVTDPFGNTYTETVKRPKAFFVRMK